MGMRTDAAIEAWQKQAGIEPATQERAWPLDDMSRAAFVLIKIIELEKSGIRDGDGTWHGSDAVGGVVQELIDAYRRFDELRMAEYGPSNPTIGEELPF
jgi:hypothetical protein